MSSELLAFRLMDQIKQHLGPQGPKILPNFGFLVVLRGPGGPGAITNRRGMKKYPGGLIFVRFGWSYEGFMPIFDF